jgi:hypothetical protein
MSEDIPTIVTLVILAIQAVEGGKMTKRLYIILAITAVLAQTAQAAYHIKYLSGENVYIDAGRSDSLYVGDRLLVRHGDSAIAELEIAFVAEKSSSCKILGSSEEIKVGDPVEISVKAKRPEPVNPLPPSDASKVVEATPPATPPPVQVTQIKNKIARLNGSVALQVYRFTDTSPAHLNFTQPSLRLNLRASKLWGRDMTLTIQSDTRYNLRTRAYGQDIPKNEWRNRIYQFSLSYAGEGSPYDFQIGRIISNKFSGVGYIDGFLAQRKVVGGLRVGGFGGTQPQWQYSSFQSSLQKYGIYANYVAGNYPLNRYESTVAATGEYHGQLVSREFFFWSNNLNLGSAWNFYHSTEIDMNRGWRKQRTNQSFSMTNLYLSARGKFGKRLTATLSYDNRKNYWTFETRSLADSLFDNVLRQGLRTDLAYRLGATSTVFSNLGYHKRSTDSRATYSGGVGFNKSNFILAKQYLNLQLAGFSGPLTGGYNLSVTLGRYLWAGNMFSLGYAAYVYKLNGGNVGRLNQAIQTNGQFNLTRRVYLSGTFEYDTGRDTKGDRLIGELGYRF